ncbi:unnamed protein product [Protopolystoma xenopodis]|uniref:Uncharacterized protein n=1 Tax=Protopolystoma xenopodis TaxID=117903 RepID=A0A448WWC4_9PLAT|nr:unnamed protein product [Protopolystoma xenopodis]
METQFGLLFNQKLLPNDQPNWPLLQFGVRKGWTQVDLLKSTPQTGVEASLSLGRRAAREGMSSNPSRCRRRPATFSRHLCLSTCVCVCLCVCVCVWEKEKKIERSRECKKGTTSCHLV